MALNEKDIANRLPADEPLPRLRRELKRTRQIYDGQPYWVYKDPLSLRYFRFNREESFVLEQLRRGVTLGELQEAHRKEFHSDLLNAQELGAFVRSLLEKNLLEMRHPERDRMYYQQHRRRWRGRLLGQLSNFMFFKIPLFDPDRALTAIHRRVSWIWTRGFFLLYLVFLAAGLSLVIRRWEDFRGMFADSFFTLYNVPLLLLALYIIWTFHEFGHGLTCKHYGGEVHEMGFIFLVFSPFFYCNVTDSWTFPNKYHRIVVTAGGILTELFFAALASFVWYFTAAPGFLHSMAFNIIITCSFSTILFNSNPLLRYDGYYMLMDLIEVPNLRKRSNDYIQNLFVRFVLGGYPAEMQEEHRFRYVFPLYAIAAYIYRWFIMFVILYFVYHMLEQVRLVWVARGVVVISSITMLLVPAVKGGQRIVSQRESLGITNKRLMGVLAVLAVILGFVLFWPMEQHVTLNFVLEPAKMQWVRSDIPGRVEWVQESLPDGKSRMRIQGGRMMAEGELAARLENREIQAEHAKKLAELELVKTDLAYYSQRGQAAREQQKKQELEKIQQDLKRLDEMLDQMQVKAPFAGRVLMQDQFLWRMAGAYVQAGEPLFLLADDSVLQAKVLVPEKTFARIFKRGGNLGQASRLMLYGFPKDVFSGRVIHASLHREEHMGEFGEKMALSNKVGGEVVTEHDPVTNQEKPVEAVYEVAIEIEPGQMPSSARSYMSGRVQIDCGSSTLYRWGYDSLLRFISPEVRL